MDRKRIEELRDLLESTKNFGMQSSAQCAISEAREIVSDLLAEQALSEPRLQDMPVCDTCRHKVEDHYCPTGEVGSYWPKKPSAKFDTAEGLSTEELAARGGATFRQPIVRRKPSAERRIRDRRQYKGTTVVIGRRRSQRRQGIPDDEPCNQQQGRTITCRLGTLGCSIHSAAPAVQPETRSRQVTHSVRFVPQTKFGSGNGNCLLACVASITHKPLEEIPDFAMSGCGWFAELYEWCLNERIGVALWHPSETPHCGFYNLNVICIFEVIGIADECHAVIGRFTRDESNRPDMIDEKEWKWTLEIVHDPNPNGVKLGELVHVIALVPSFEAELSRTQPAPSSTAKEKS